MEKKAFEELINEIFNGFDHFIGFNPNIDKINITSEKVSDVDGEWIKHTFESINGTFIISTSYKKKEKSIEQLQMELDKAVEEEDYKKASEIRDLIKIKTK